MRAGEGDTLRFGLAPMSAMFWWITLGVLPIPAGLGVAALAVRQVQWPLLGVAGFMAAIYFLVWLYYRPSAFELDGDALRIVWPARLREIPLRSVCGAALISRKQLKARVGRGYRVGAGGLWGAFGQLRTQRAGPLAMYISRYDVFVLVSLEGDDDLLITPRNAPEFVHQLCARIAPRT